MSSRARSSHNGSFPLQSSPRLTPPDSLKSDSDFSQTDLLPQFYSSLEIGLKGNQSEGGMYIGTPLPPPSPSREKR